MKQVTLRGGEAIVEEVPAPCLNPGQVLVKVAWSCVSPGTELASADRMRAANILERYLLTMAKEQLSVSRHQVIVALAWC